MKESQFEIGGDKRISQHLSDLRSVRELTELQTNPFRPCEMLSPGSEFLAGVIFVVSGRVRPMDALGTGFATTFF